MNKSIEITEAVFDILSDRGGFDDWWDNIDVDTTEAIKQEIVTVVKNEIPQSTNEWIEVTKESIKQIPEGTIILFKNDSITHVGERWGDRFLYMAGCHLQNYTQECIKEVTHWMRLPE